MISLSETKKILKDNDPKSLECLAQKAKRLTEQYFGHAISLYAPLYLSNYCSSHCIYCGFNNHNRIKRFKLNLDEMRQEMSYIKNKGIENVLLLTGESYKATPLSYLKDAVTTAKDFFTSISLEVHPMDEKDYHELFLNGADGLTIYQETYDRKRYKQVHVSGKKADYDYRRETPKRAAKAGFRHISLGILLGLSVVADDLWALYKHLAEMEKSFPAVEYSLSFPRLRPIKGENFALCDVDDKTFIKIIALTRTLFPRVGINLSTREPAYLRDHALGLGITRISAESNTSVGGYTLQSPDVQEPQFDIKDNRSVKEIIRALKHRGFDPVLTDWRRIDNR
ncbi:MAG: 2-iminoacetate synthase ThiH [Candidatus Omnitrophica bacterium]|nr:2-iminoacetate synthase ThiH [Candidatus Omnitrophota bacterium]